MHDTEKEKLPISKETEPYQLPEGWEWTRLEDICYGITSGSTPSKAYLSTGKGIPFIKVHNIVNNKIDFQKIQYIDETIHSTKNERSILYPGDVIMNIVGPPLGKIAIIPDRYPELNCNQAIVFFRPVMKELNRWIYIFLCEGSFLRSIRLIGTDGQDNISITKSRNIMIPLPPLAEQELITKKVDQLANLVEKCEEYIKQSNEYSAALMESLLEETFSFERSKSPSKRAILRKSNPIVD